MEERHRHPNLLQTRPMTGTEHTYIYISIPYIGVLDPWSMYGMYNCQSHGPSNGVSGYDRLCFPVRRGAKKGQDGHRHCVDCCFTVTGSCSTVTVWLPSGASTSGHTTDADDLICSGFDGQRADHVDWTHKDGKSCAPVRGIRSTGRHTPLHRIGLWGPGGWQGRWSLVFEHLRCYGVVDNTS